MNDGKKIHVDVVKEFFIHTITKDVDLADCVLDLLDNCIDGAKRIIEIEEKTEESYEDFRADIALSADHFSIRDNCGGIPLDHAINYAFYFGRRQDAPPGPKGQIGVYGIGMKRAIFKLGEKIEIATSTADEAYTVLIDVPKWQKQGNDWDFDYEDGVKGKFLGTNIEIRDLNKEVSEAFKLDRFRNSLIRTIARDYSFILQKGFKVKVNDYEIPAYEFRLREGGADFKAMNNEYHDDEERDVIISLRAGMADIPPEDETSEGLEKIREADYYGWFVACNDRIVLAGDKTHRTVWGNSPIPLWHPQFYGFMGIVNFKSSDPRKLPWTTSKRGLDPESALYRRVVTKMKEVTRVYIDYTNVRKENPETARELELKAEPKALFDLGKSEKIVFPPPKKPKIKMVNIQYRKPEELVMKVAESLGDRNMYNKEVGIQTFDHYVEMELEDEQD